MFSRSSVALRIGYSAAAAALVLVGGGLNGGDRSGWAAVLAALAGVLAVAAGVAYTNWRLVLPLGGAALVVCLGIAALNSVQTDFLLQLAGLVLLGIGGLVGGIAYRSFAEAIGRQAVAIEGLTNRLEQKHRAFVAATSDADGSPAPQQPAGIEVLTASIAREVGADFACCFLASPDGKQFVPQPPGIGLDRLHPQAVNRSPNGAGPLVSAVEAGRRFVGHDSSGLTELAHYLPDDFRVEALMAVPVPIGERIGGFVLLGSRSEAFDDDDQRLATTLATRAGSQLASAHAVAMSRQESARYTLMNELVKEASGKTMGEALAVVLAKGREVIRYDGGRAILFQPDGTYVEVEGDSDPRPLDAALAKVRHGETVLRNLVAADEPAYSGLRAAGHDGASHEALTPIRGRGGVIGALCLGRVGTGVFAQRDIAALDELGSMAGVAVENSRLLQAVSGQASRLDVALDALGEVSQALTTVTQGAGVLEQKTLEAAVKVTLATAGLLTRTTAAGHQSVIMSLGLPEEVGGMVFQNGQGIVGAVMLSHRPTAVPDVKASFDLASPPDLAAYGLHAAMCTPMLEEGHLWGTLSVFDSKRRDWTANDQRVLATLGNQGVVAVRNAELYDHNQRSIWELRNLQEALQAATSTLDLYQVLQQVLAGAAKASSAQIGCLALEESGRLMLKAGFGTDHVTAERLALVVGGDVCRDVMATGEPVMQALEHETTSDSPLDPRAVLCVPITLRGKPQGVLFLANYQVGHVFSEDHRHVVTELAAQAAVVIDNARLFKEREDFTLESLEALARALERSDRYTDGHSERVTQYALTIARQMNYAPKDPAAWMRLERGGRLHDIGKVVVPDAILFKPGKLTDDEFETMKSHTVVGYDILSVLKMLTDELVIVRSHHERYDGKGYPDRKKGNEVPVFAWIVSAADAIDAMTSDRPYRRAMSMEVAVDQVRLGAGTHFHPDVAEAVLDAVRNGTLTVIEQKSMYADSPAIGAFENPVG